ncbi:MAG: hypothetical protein ABS76_18215 [Pelagibacterium sp. SCN 64-44]|nr:MAG: hypothetical protein ABS76_18215 [Pelagibacterium sp. SCN 64-44]
MVAITDDIFRDRPPEELHNIRLIRSISGCYTLSSRKNDGSGRSQVFACRTQSVSPTAIVLEAPVCGAVGETVLVKLVDVGILHGQIDRQLRAGFNLALDLTSECWRKFGWITLPSGRLQFEGRSVDKCRR